MRAGALLVVLVWVALFSLPALSAQVVREIRRGGVSSERGILVTPQGVYQVKHDQGVVPVPRPVDLQKGPQPCVVR